MASQPFVRGTNIYFDNYTHQGEQDLWEDLIIESIKMYGIDTYYIPREVVHYDSLYGADDISKYTKAIPIELYITSVDGFEGDGVFLSKFGLEIRDQVTFTVAKRIFEEEVGQDQQQIRPNEGDVIYFPLNDKLFQIKFVNYKPFFYQHGTLQTYDLVCELFEYSSEEFDTGIEAIDEIQTKYSIDIMDYALKDEEDYILQTEDENFLVTEKYEVGLIGGAVSDDPNIPDEPTSGADNEDIQEEQEILDVFDWSELDPFSEEPY